MLIKLSRKQINLLIYLYTTAFETNKSLFFVVHLNKNRVYIFIYHLLHILIIFYRPVNFWRVIASISIIWLAYLILEIILKFDGTIKSHSSLKDKWAISSWTTTSNRLLENSLQTGCAHSLFSTSHGKYTSKTGTPCLRAATPCLQSGCQVRILDSCTFPYYNISFSFALAIGYIV